MYCLHRGITLYITRKAAPPQLEGWNKRHMCHPFYRAKVSPLLLNISPMEEKDSASARITGHAKTGALLLGLFCSFSALVAACTISYVKVCALYVVNHCRTRFERFVDKLTL
mmetsp:Transcript_4428/g.28242  ORF Transcript_4428/g.28242 Transcript_4428/m.28242 type:complete len:112 (-) Transcript_4428:65-400(-)